MEYMRIALLSDIHGNLDALVASLNSIRNSECELLIVSGDIVGYYFEPNQVLDALSEFNYHFVSGNHEAMLGKLIEDPQITSSIRKKYGMALEIALEKLSQEQIDFLTKAPITKSLQIEGKLFNISHGSPWSVDDYFYPDTERTLWDRFLELPEEVFVLGNTHHQLLKRHGGKIIVNPGSVGQSRTDPGYAQWVEIDTLNMDFTFKSVRYDTKRLIDLCHKIEPDLKVLTRHLIS
jgi:putative phosphoesterase